MPNKKAKANASKGKTPAAPELTQAAIPAPVGPVEPPTTTTASQVQPTLPPPTFSEDFWTKNARAKALIMSTLVPGSEAWKIAEPMELASNIMTALEQKYAPKDANGKPLRGKDLAAWDRENNKGRESRKHGPVAPADIYDDPTSSEFIGDFVAGKPMDKYLNIYKEKRGVPQVDGARDSRDVKGGMPATTAQQAQEPSNRQPGLPPIHTLSQHRVPSYLPSDTEPDLPIPDTFDLPAQAPAQAKAKSQMQTQTPPQNPLPPLATTPISAHWTAHDVKHESYLTEHQAGIIADHDPDRKTQIQAATTKVLMQKLPSRDLRLLWAVLYGGENAPWPGSCSAIIPGVTTSEADAQAASWTWNRKTEKG